MITEPGIYCDIPEADYHADPVDGGSLSSSAVRVILDAPARYRYSADNPVFKDAFDFGSVVHELALGTGGGIVEIDAPDWRTKAAKEARDAARGEGKTPLLTKDLVVARAAVDALMAHPTANTLLTAEGRSEVTVVWEQAGTMRRARIDRLRDGDPVIAVDLKTTRSAEPRAFSKSAYNFGYHHQAAWYLDGLMANGIDAEFVIVAVESDPPHLVTTHQFDAEMLDVARRLNESAAATWRQCREADEWPGYSPEMQLIQLPAWA